MVKQAGRPWDSLEEHTAHLWCAPLPVTKRKFEYYLTLLSEEERAHAKTLIATAVKERYICGRGGLRSILARYLNRHPTSLAFAYQTYGKPMLAGSTDLDFNLAHTDQYILYGLTKRADIGVDIEFMRPIDFEALSKRFFSEREFAQVMAAKQEERLATFYRIWTYKEAFVKAIGMGLSCPLSDFEIELAPHEETARLIRTIDPAAYPPAQYELRSWVPYPNYVASLVTKQSLKRIDYWLC